MLSRGRPFRQYIPFMILSAHWSWWFFPRPFQRYGILCHGLCHTTLMNHHESSWIIQKALVSDWPLQHWPSHPSCAVCIPWNKNVKGRLSDAVDAFSMACSGVCVCVFLVFRLDFLPPPFFGTVFFPPGCQQQQHAIHHLIHHLSLGLAITTAELRISKSLGTLQGDVLSYIFNICQSIWEWRYWCCLFSICFCICCHCDLLTISPSWYLKKPILFSSYVLTQPKERHWGSAMDASTAFTSWAASFPEGIFVVPAVLSEFWGAKDLHFSMKCLATEFTNIYYTCCVDANLSIVMFHYFSSLYVTCIDRATVRIRYYLQFTINLNPWLNSKQAHGMS